jgi:hypothetical protein
MRQVLFALISVLVFISNVGIGSAQQSSKGVVPRPGAVYNPSTVYAGDYDTDMVLFKNDSKDMTWRRISNLDQLSKITCPQAQEQLKREGRWQGHLNLDGSCGSTYEPADWTLGNRLNYEEALELAAR